MVLLDLEKVVLLDIEEDDLFELKIRKMLNQMIEREQEKGTYLSTYEIQGLNFEWLEEDFMVFNLVKKAIDALDPYCVHPDSWDEYDGESRRIAEQLREGMSIDEIAQVMKEEFNWAFSADFTRGDFIVAAKTVYDLLKDCSQEKAKDEDGMMKKYAYIIVKLSKTVSMIDSDDEYGIERVREVVFDEIDSDDKKDSTLSSFSISVGLVKEM